MDVKISQNWKDLLAGEFNQEYFAKLVEFIKQEYGKHIIYPPGKLIFNAFEHTKPEDIKVVLLGQDPYHGPNQAHGLCFSVQPGVPMPPSLKNIFLEIEQDIGSPIPANGDLTRWADQGVMLLNATLTVQAHTAGSHQGKGWEQFTDSVIKLISDKYENIVFILWGNYARQKKILIDTSKHLILEAAHPSPFSVHKGFFGCKHFSKTNEYLKAHGKTEIKW